MEKLSISLTEYNYTLPLINELRTLITESYTDLFHSVLVHGSIATNEVVPYSDFDGLLIVKDKFENSKQLKDFKKQSMKLIYKFDPIQHHGWFQIKESELKNYPESYFPSIILSESKYIFTKETNLLLNLKDNNIDYKIHLIKILDQFEERFIRNWRPQNMFQLKSVLSQIMLLPSLYYSAKYSKGILKRDSFTVVREYFNDEQWMPIKIASNIRKTWNYDLNKIQRIALQIPDRKARKFLRRFFSPSIHLEFQLLMDKTFHMNLQNLLKKIRLDTQ